MDSLTKRRKPLKVQRIDPRDTTVFLDANALDDCMKCDNECVERICYLNKNLNKYQVGFILPRLVRQEIGHPNTPEYVKNRASDFIYTTETHLNSEENAKMGSLVYHFKGNGVGGRHDDDSNHIFEALKYGAGYFITEDKRILKKSEDLNILALSRSDFFDVLKEFEI